MNGGCDWSMTFSGIYRHRPGHTGRNRKTNQHIRQFSVCLIVFENAQIQSVIDIVSRSLFTQKTKEDIQNGSKLTNSWRVHQNVGIEVCFGRCEFPG
jgi:hypothetical protein